MISRVIQMRFTYPAFAILFNCAIVTVAAQPSAPRWRVIEEIRIDGEREEFSVPNAFILIDRHGGMAFEDRARMQVRFYDATGKHRLDIGGRGGGPGEFAPGGRLGSIIAGFVGDSIWYYDLIGRRMTLVTRQGRLLRSVTMKPLPALAARPGDSARAPGFQPLAVYGDGSMLGRRTVFIAADAGGRKEDIVHVNADATAVRTVLDIPSQESFVVVNRQTGRGQSFAVRGAARPISHVSQDGNRVVIVHQNISATRPTMRISVLSPRGDTLVARSLPITPAPARQAEFEQILTMQRRDLEAARPPHDKQFIDEFEQKMRAATPKVIAPISMVRLGIDNTIWLALPAQRDSQPWLVLDPNGNPIGQLMVRSGGVGGGGFITAAVSRERLWGIQTNSDGVPSIIRYRVEPVR
jgi:hypothetical protein